MSAQDENRVMMQSKFLPKLENLKKLDLEIYNAINQELMRQEFGLEMIASENYVSLPILEAQGSILTNKYAEGYPGKRYYGGCVYVDQIESLAIQRAKKLFSAESANVQAHSGSQANMAVYFSVLKPGETLMGMSLSHGGHLTHGSKVSFSGLLYNAIEYKIDSKSERLDYNKILDLAKKTKPKLIIAGYSSYPRILDFSKFREIANITGSKLLVDMAHFAGLVAGGAHPSPVPYADFITSTTHKTLRGPRGGFILTTKEHEGKLNSKIFPGLQGGPLEHTIAGKAICFFEALKPEFKTYAHQIILNAKALALELLEGGFSLVTGGTDNHLILIDLPKSKIGANLTGREAEKVLEKAGITVNKNAVPDEKRSPFVTSGLRIGTPALTSRGFKEKEMKVVGKWILRTLKNFNREDVLEKIKNEVFEFCKAFPIYF